MKDFQDAVGRFIAGVDDRIGWGRIGVTISLAIIAVAAYVLYGILQKIDWAEVGVAFSSKPHSTLVMAALCVTCAYSTLTFYDWLALRTIGRRDVPYRIAALAGFSSYAIGHNVGATVFSGGLVRYRIYTLWGLSFTEVARLIFIAGLTFWLGNVAVLGIGITYEPQAASAIVEYISPPIWRVISIGALVFLCAYVIWVGQKPQTIGVKNVTVTLPGAGLTIFQIIIGIADLMFCATAMYLLLPVSPHIDFTALAVIFVASTILGFASHAPGGLGVFDAAMLVGLSQFDREEVLAALLLFRVFYYLIPFVLSLTLMGARELLIGLQNYKPK